MARNNLVPTDVLVPRTCQPVSTNVGGTTGPMMPEGSSAVSLTYLASEKVVPGYGGGMSSAKAQLESDTKVGAAASSACPLISS
jgi:hypothetical protein